MIMRILQQRHDEQCRPPAVGDPNADSQLDRLRSESDRLLAAGDEAIRRALEGSNSEKFLRASRQEGGE
jgi:hypothetical protein